MNSHSPLHSLFQPLSVAVVGVSDQRQKLGSVIFRNLIYGGYEGKLYPINPKYQELWGRRCYANVSEIGETVDLVIIVVPSTAVNAIAEDSGKAGAKHVMVISAGFGEGGNPEGLKREQELQALTKQYNFTLVGPNCLGIMTPNVNLNASFAPFLPADGNVAFMSQSGAFNTALLDVASHYQFGFRYLASIGNKAGLTENDLLREWLHDPEVKVIGGYLESFVDGNEWLQIIDEAPRKPIIVLKPGTSEAAQEAMASHTGSLAGSSRIIEQALKQWGVIQLTDNVADMQSVIATLRLFQSEKKLNGPRMAIITNAGGPGVMLTDLVSRAGLQLAELSDTTQQLLAQLLPPAASTHNPIDILGDALANRYQQSLELLVDNPEVDGIFVLVTPQHVTQVVETAKVVSAIAHETEKLIVPIWAGGTFAQAGWQWFQSEKSVAFHYAAPAVTAVKNLWHYQQQVERHSPQYQSVNQWRKSRPQQSLHKIHNSKKALQFEEDTRQQVPSLEERALPAEQARELLESVGIRTPREQTVHSLQETIAFWQQGKAPIVMKATADLIAHKTDEKALFLSLNDQQSIEQAWYQLQQTLQKHTDHPTPPVLLQEMLQGKVELILGAQRDGDENVYEAEGKGFGHAIIMGHGGIYAEVWQDTAMRLVPFDRDQALQMVNETKVSKLLHGFRGEPKLALDQVLDTLIALQQLVVRHPEVSSLDINPLLVSEDECVAVDAKIFVR